MNHTITEHDADQRVDRFCRKYFKAYPEIKLGDIFSWIRKGAIKVNEKKTAENYRLTIGDIISRDENIMTDKKAADATKSKSKKIHDLPVESIEAYIIHEDDHRLVFDKPVGIVMHPGQKHDTDITMHDMMQSYLKKTGGATWTETFSPQFCFRLDKDTSGVLIAAKHYQALQQLNDIIKSRKIDKSYYAIVTGALHKKTTVDQPLFTGFDKKFGKGKTFVNHQTGKEALSIFDPKKTIEHDELGTITLAHVTIKTGRMHQIRVHAAHIGHPVIGDIMYGNAAVNRIATKKVGITRQLLHSHTYGFFDPLNNKHMQFTAPVPSHFTSLMNKGNNA